MAIHYNIIQRSEPGVAGGGDKKYYASAITTGDFDIDGLTERIEKISTVSGPDIHAVLYSLIDVIPEELSQGRIIRLRDLGAFRVSISSHGHETEEEVNASSVRDSRIIFTPGPKLRRMLLFLQSKANTVKTSSFFLTKTCL